MVPRRSPRSRRCSQQSSCLTFSFPTWTASRSPSDLPSGLMRRQWCSSRRARPPRTACVWKRRRRVDSFLKRRSPELRWRRSCPEESVDVNKLRLAAWAAVVVLAVAVEWLGRSGGLGLGAADLVVGLAFLACCLIVWNRETFRAVG